MDTHATSSDFAAYLATSRMRRAARQAALDQFRNRALSVARRSAARLKSDFHATRVMAFGSVLRPEAFHERSDLDLAAWGLTETNYWAAIAALEDLDPTLSIDLVRVETARPGLVAAIEAQGLPL
jgi:predicted nucleotidyltransferase